MTSSSSSPLSSRSISEVISSLRTSFRDNDFKEAERQLKAREDILLRREKEAIDVRWREKCDILEAKASDLELEVLRLEEERRRLRRECEINENRVSDLARELSLMNEREEKAIKRYDLSLNEIRDGERKNDELLQKLEEAQSSYLENVAALKDENDELRRGMREKEEEIMVLVEKSNESWERGKREAEAELVELRAKVEVMEAAKVKLDAQLKELRENHMKKDVRINEVVKENEGLEMGKREAEGEVEGLQRKVENLEVEKMEIMEKNECLETEKKELLKEKNEAIWRYEQLEQQVLKLENDVASWMVPTDKKLSSAQIGKILCGVITALDCEEVGIICNAQTNKGGKLHEGASVASDSEMKFEAAIGTKKGASSAFIVLSDSESDSENPPKRKRTDVQHELVKHEPLISASSSRSHNKFVTPQKHMVASLRQCDERTTQTDTFVSPQARELIASCRRSRAL